jgi:hypothetical protein
MVDALLMTRCFRFGLSGAPRRGEIVTISEMRTTKTQVMNEREKLVDWLGLVGGSGGDCGSRGGWWEV